MREARFTYLSVGTPSCLAIKATNCGGASQLSSDAGRAAYAEQIAGNAGDEIAENTDSPEGTRTAFVWSNSDSAKVVISSRPVYEATARATLLVAREPAELDQRPAGFQALSSIARSTEYA